MTALRLVPSAPPSERIAQLDDEIEALRREAKSFCQELSDLEARRDALDNQIGEVGAKRVSLVEHCLDLIVRRAELAAEDEDGAP